MRTFGSTARPHVPALIFAMLSFGVHAEDCRSLSMTTIGELRAPTTAEASGLVLAQGAGRRFWTINDSGNPAQLLLIDPRGALEAQFDVDTHNRDWEALSGFEADGRPMLLLADTGDNLRNQRSYRLSIIEEPEPGGDRHPDTPLAVLRQMRFAYPVGSRNTEAVAISRAERRIYLLPRRPLGTDHRQNQSDSHVELFTLPLPPVDQSQASGSKTLIATARGRAPLVSVALDRFLETLTGVDVTQPTDASISADDSAFWVASYRYVFVWFRGESTLPWYQILQQQPPQTIPHNLHQAEAIAAASGCNAYLTSEKVPAPLVRISDKSSAR